ncbi:unnamed protein product [Dicrocoelium dendriticum]|nr:unnamed protein product [Dicrocoelium dendriticum]
MPLFCLNSTAQRPLTDHPTSRPSSTCTLMSSTVTVTNDPRLAADGSNSQTPGSQCPAIATASHSTEAPALLRPGSPFILAAFNVRTLMQIGRQACLARTLETPSVDICCLSETRLQDSSAVIRMASPVNSDAKYYLRLSGDPESAAIGQAGVGVVLSARAESALLDWIPVNSRLCAVRLRGSCNVSRRRDVKRALFVVSAYAPTDCSQDAVKDSFYQQLHELLRSSKRTDIVILAGDFNARVGRLLPSEHHIGGSFGLGGSRSDNGDRLLALCSDHRLFLSSTSFRHSRRQTATWRPQECSQLDPIAISYRWHGSVTDCRSYWSTFLDSDHALVRAKICMRFGGSPKHAHYRPEVANLQNAAILTRYQASLSTLLGSTIDRDLDSQWAHIKGALVAASIDSCGVTRHPPKHWISADSLSLMDKRRLIPSDSRHVEERQYLGRELRRSLQMDRKAWWCERAREMELASLCGNTRQLFHLLRVTEGVRSGISETICEEDGTLITNLQRRLERWAEHFGSQFCWPPAPSATSGALALAEWSTPTDPPSSQEIEQELRHLKRYKAPGPDGLHPALFKDGGASLVRELTVLFSKIWSKEKVPSSWGESIVVPIFKKGLRTICSNYRGISLVPVVCKLLVSIILRRLSPTRESLQREEQAGFRPGRGCIDQIFTLRQILELRHVYQRPTIAVFLVIRAAFDSVDRTVLWQCLLRNGVPEKFVCILRALYSLTSGRVRAYGMLSPTFVVSSGVRQGCPISPFLFNFAIEDVLRNALSDSLNAGVELLPGSRVVDLDYADDIVLLGDDPQVVQLAFNRLTIEASKYGMYFSPSKCKALLQDWQVPLPALTLAGETLEVVESFVYLGCCITAGGAVGDEISMRISKARLAFSRLRHLWRRHDIRLSIKGRVYCATVRAVLLYGCKTWPIRKDDLSRLSVFEHRCLRSIARVWCQHHVSNVEVRQRVLGRGSHSLEELISLHQLRWLGHVLRMPVQRYPRRALFALAGQGWKRRSGGQPTTWRSRMKKLTKQLASAGCCRLPGWGPRDEDTCWLKTLEVMAQDRCQ